MNTKNILEEYRVASLLSEKMDVVNIEGFEPITFFSGFIVPLRITTVLIIWVKTGTQVHNKHVNDNDLKLIQQLNSDIKLFNDKGVIIPKLYATLYDLGPQWINDNINSLTNIEAA